MPQTLLLVDRFHINRFLFVDNVQLLLSLLELGLGYDLRSFLVLVLDVDYVVLLNHICPILVEVFDGCLAGDRLLLFRSLELSIGLSSRG